MDNLPQTTKLPKKIQNKLLAFKIDAKVGDQFLDRDGRLLRINKINRNGIHYEYFDGEEWRSWGETTFENFHRKNYIKIDKPIEELEKEVLEQLNHLEVFEDTQEGDPESTELAMTHGTDYILNAEKTMVAKMQKMEMMQRILERKKDALYCYIYEQEAKIKQVRKVLGVIELYMGVYEEVVQIQEGSNADPSVPINFRQRILYMDEEVGNYDDGGIDIAQIKDFDDWLTSDPVNLAKILPEEKGVIALQVRRHAKRYTEDAFTNIFMNEGNFRTYLLIRNGDNLYRIFSNLTITPRLFPTRKEFDNMAADQWSDNDKIRDRAFDYRKHGIFLQGLLDRTDIFSPISPDIKVFDETTWNGMLNFIFDDDMLLPTGKLLWRKWKEEINDKIKIGSRIFFLGGDSFDLKTRYPSEGYAYTVGVPDTGVYEVKGKANNEYRGFKFKFIFNPYNEVYTYGYYAEQHTRTRGVGFDFYQNDGCILNYDQISLEDIEFYLDSRIDRENYLDMLPILREIRQERLKELKYEKECVKLISGRLSVTKDVVWKAVEWWKYKNKWKRSINKDDAKAVRMIERHIRKG